MGACKFCGNDAGWFKDEHPACHQLHDTGWREMLSLAQNAASQDGDLVTLRDRLAERAKATYQAEDSVPAALVAGWEGAATKAIEDKVLSREEEALLMKYATFFHLSQPELDKGGSYTRVVMGATLREVLGGKLPARITVDLQLPFNFQKDESLVWVFQNVRYYEMRTRRVFEGGSAGVSVRVAKGLYFRTSSFRGQPVENSELQQVDIGLFAVTNKHLYFSGSAKSFRVPYKKIVSFKPYSDAIGIVRDAASAKPQVFITGEGWFAYNLVVNLAGR